MKYPNGSNATTSYIIKGITMSIKRELDKIVELENEGYKESGYMCPDCGTDLLEKEYLLRSPDTFDEMYEVHRECPHCSYSAVFYDD